MLFISELYCEMSSIRGFILLGPPSCPPKLYAKVEALAKAASVFLAGALRLLARHSLGDGGCAPWLGEAFR